MVGQHIIKAVKWFFKAGGEATGGVGALADASLVAFYDVDVLVVDVDPKITGCGKLFVGNLFVSWREEPRAMFAGFAGFKRFEA